MIRKISPAHFLSGAVCLPGDKSISHRCLIFGAMAEGNTLVHNFLPSKDTLATEECLKALQIRVNEPDLTTRLVCGNGLRGFKEPCDVLDARNSGTTMRLLLGLLAGQDFFSVITGDASLRKRPMERVVVPLRAMGALISGRDQGKLAPLSVQGGLLRAMHYKMPVASAQVKSALMIAALFAEGETVLLEPLQTRDHTERLFDYMEALVQKNENEIKVIPGSPLKGREIFVPGDFSSAAFFLVAGLGISDSSVQIRDVGLNPTRTAFLNVLRRMGGRIEVKEADSSACHEPLGTLKVSSSELKATDIEPHEVPGLIDELPVFAVAASQAKGVSTVRGASELRVKESDRIASICLELRKMGVEMEELPDGFAVKGPVKLRGAEVDSHSDHRLAMALTIAGLLAEGETVLEGAETADISFPGFFETVEALLSGK